MPTSEVHIGTKEDDRTVLDGVEEIITLPSPT